MPEKEIDFTTEMNLLEIPTDFVVLENLSNASEEDILSGDKLKEGMIVLLEDMSMRGNPVNMTGSPYDFHRTMVMSRWCRVTNLRIDGDIVRFTGIYGDNTQAAHTFNQSWQWRVKK